MRIICLQHVPFEGPAAIGAWADHHGYPIEDVPLYKGAPLPPLNAFDRLIVMGGPMGIYDEDRFPWLAEEKRFIRLAIGAGKTVIGVCLGAQLIAAVLGARVYANGQKEIGWFPVELTQAGCDIGIADALLRHFQVFHWHGDTFDLPSGALHLARSAVCENQAFLYRERVLGLQFHVESTPESVRAIVANCADEIVPGPYVQDARRILQATPEDFTGIAAVLYGIMDWLP